MSDQSEPGNAAHTPDIIHGKAIRDSITQALSRRSQTDCNDPRHRFVPRAALFDVISLSRVEQLLQTIPAEDEEDGNLRQRVAQQICPSPDACSCTYLHCTGGRMIFSTLLLCAREDLLLTSFFLRTPKICDQDLPLRLPSLDDINYNPNPIEKQLFIHNQWRVYTPLLTEFDTQEDHAVKTFPEEVSLPWAKKERIGNRIPGEVSYVEKVEIDPFSHGLAPQSTQTFALKTFEQRLAPGLSRQRFEQEVKANLWAPKHDRIVRLLTAFTYRERFYLLFPHATEGSLEKLWKSYAPTGVVQDSTPQDSTPQDSTPQDSTPQDSTPQDPTLQDSTIQDSALHVHQANWYTEHWLVDQCHGIASALAAIHGRVDVPSDQTKGLLHADIKPENILCFRDSGSAGPPVLKLADFGEAKVIDPHIPLKASKVAHVLTYRPPEHSPNSQITLNYDVWCLGCLFLDFITWAMSGQDGIDCFSRDREDEQDDSAVTQNPGQLIEDTFFRLDPASLVSTRLRPGWGKDMKVRNGLATTWYSLWVASNVKVNSRLKYAVISHLEFLKQHDRCSDRLRQLLRYIGANMLVVDANGRASSREVRDFLNSLLSRS